MPRAGFAWLATPKTSVRGGYGLFYDVLGTNRITVNQVGYSRDTALTPSIDNGQTFRATLANPFPDGLLEPVGSALGLMTNVGPWRELPVRRRRQEPAHHRWSLGLQRELPWQLLVEATYVGSHSEHLPVTRQLNAVPAAVPLDLAGARRCDEQPACRSRCRTRLSGWCRPGSPARTSRAASCFVPIRSSLGPGDRDERTVRLQGAAGEGRAADGQRVHRADRLRLVAVDDRDRLPQRLRHRRSSASSARSIASTRSWRAASSNCRSDSGRRYGSSWGGVTNAVLGGWQVGYIFKAQSGAPLGFGNFLFAERHGR